MAPSFFGPFYREIGIRGITYVPTLTSAGQVDGRNRGQNVTSPHLHFWVVQQCAEGHAAM